MKKTKDKRIYLDYAASTPIDQVVIKKMTECSANIFGNPQSVHSFGQEAIKFIDDARNKIANSINANFSEIIFTGSATEANNIAIRGMVKNFSKLNKKNIKPRLIISSIEHESVIKTAEELELEGVEIIHAPVNSKGIVDINFIEKYLDEKTAGISIMYANNEIGTIEPIIEISEIIKKFEKSLSKEQFKSHMLFHTDAVQAFQFLNCDVNLLGIDFMTISAHKIYGPKGIGVLYARGNTASKKIIDGIILGGGQEFGIRSGTENTPSIVGFGEAVELRSKMMNESNKKILELKKLFWESIKKIYPSAEINGISDFSIKNKETVPHILNVYFPKNKSENILTKLDLLGVAVSSGSACSARALQLSYVIYELYKDKNRAESSVRFSLGNGVNRQDILKVVSILKQVLQK